MELSPEGFSQLAAILESGSDLSEEDREEDALLQEVDEAKEKLAEFEQASEALLAELNSLEAEYEIEKRCREQAESYAAQGGSTVIAPPHCLKRIFSKQHSNKHRERRRHSSMIQQYDTNQPVS